MDYQDYVDKANAASKHFDAGEYEEAMAGFEALIHSDISDIDKSMMAYNMSRVCEQAGHPEHALQWLDYGISLEEPYCRCYILEHKAAYFANNRRDAEALAIYDHIYKLPHITENDKQRVWQNIVVLRNPRPA